MRTSRGFTLMEIMVAIFVLSIAVMGLASVLAGSSRRHERSVSYAELTAAAESKFEDLRSMAAPDTMELTVGGSLTQDVADHSDTLVTAYGRVVRRRWVVASGPAQTRAVTVSIFPEDATRNDHGSLTFRTLVASP